MNKNILMVGVCVVGLSTLAACTGNGSGSATVEGDIPIAYVKRSNTISINPTDAGNSQGANAVGGNLYIRDKSSPSATEYNITGAITAGKGDVSRPEVSYDGKKIVFAMRCASGTPCSTMKKAGEPDGVDTTWSIWEYDFSKAKTLDQGDLHRIMTLADAGKGDDYDPTYLPGGKGFVFTSRRQAKSSANLSSGGPVFPGQPGYTTVDEYEREGVANLHTMDAKGENIQQISFNQSHDRSPTILQDGQIMYSRWDHVGGRNHFSLFTVNPDGTKMFVLYGAHSDGNSRLHPREMQDGRVITDLMPLSRTQEGGALMVLDVKNYSEQGTPANSHAPTTGGQQQATTKPLDFNSRTLSLNGRITTPYPLWDGTNRVLIAFSPCQVTKNGQVKLCADLSPSELAGLTQNRLQAAIDADPVKDNAPVTYSIQMFDMNTQTMREVVKAEAGMMVKDPVALMARKEPNSLPTATPTTPGPTPETGTLTVLSVYDTDGLGRMGSNVLSASEQATAPIATIPKTDPEDTRPRVADILRIKNPLVNDPAHPLNAYANPTDRTDRDPKEYKNIPNYNAYLNRPARFVRITRAVATPRGISREIIGETDFEMQQILGYADVEPDGSFTLNVPADTPIGITVTDAKGRAFQAHTNWIQVRPGETRTCDGCHSPRRGAALNSGPILDQHPNTLLATAGSEVMAVTRAVADPSVLKLKSNIEYTDVWADTGIPGVVATPCVSLRYSGSTTCAANSADVLGKTAPVPAADGSITINYPDHIQPLWEKVRPAGACISCHADPVKLDLTQGTGPSGTGRYSSYQELMVGDPVIDANGFPVTKIEEGVEVVETGPALVNTMASQGDARGLARKSRLIEILSGDVLLADDADRTAYPDPALTVPTPPDHTKMMNAAEMRLLAEWIDLGGQYYNTPYTIKNGVAELRVATGLSRADFDNATTNNGNKSIHSILLASCGGCHRAGGSVSTPATPPPTFQNNRFVLTGGSEGDYNVTLSMVRDVCKPTESYLLYRPSTLDSPTTPNTHPAAPGVIPPSVVLQSGSADYVRIQNWIGAACPLAALPIP